MERKSRLQRKFEQAYDSSLDVHTRTAALLAVIRTTNAAITPEQCYEVNRSLFRMQGMLPIIALFPAVNSAYMLEQYIVYSSLLARVGAFWMCKRRRAAKKGEQQSKDEDPGPFQHTLWPAMAQILNDGQERQE